MLFAGFSYSMNSGDEVTKYCESCAYHGTSFKVRLDKKSGKYVLATIAPCELYKNIIPDSCSSSMYSLFLKGHVGGAKNTDNLVLGMRYAYRTGYYEVSDTLAIPDKYGAFSFYVTNKQHKCIAIMQKDSSFLLYNMEWFGKNNDQQPTSDTCVLIHFKDSLSVTWSNTTSTIKKDTLFNILCRNFQKNESYFIAQINNLELTSAEACNKKTRLVKGDIAYLVIDQIKMLPFFEITGMQCDVFYAGCPYPDGFFQTIDQKRSEIAVKVERYLNPPRRSTRRMPK